MGQEWAAYSFDYPLVTSKSNRNWPKIGKTKIGRKNAHMCFSEAKGLIDTYHVNLFKKLYSITHIISLHVGANV